MQIEPTQAAPNDRIDSDRESLPFPSGGVFAGQKTAQSEEENDMYTTTDDVIANIDRLFDVVQGQLDTVSEEVEHHLHLPASEENDYDPLPAA
jgi:hypothetical protein